MVKFKIRKDDRVYILTGKEKGKTGTVKKVLVDACRVIVEGLNQVVCFNKKTREGMTKKEASIHISNVAHVDPVSKKPTRVKILVNGDVKQVVAKKSGKIIR